MTVLFKKTMPEKNGVKMYFYKLAAPIAEVEDLPTTGVADGSECKITDVGSATYYFDEESQTWNVN